MVAIGLAVAAVIAAVVLVEALCFTIALYEALHQARGTTTRLSAETIGAAARVFVLETAALVALVLATPLAWLPWRRVPRLEPTDRPPLVFVPGWLGSRASVLLMRHRLRRDGWPHAIAVGAPATRGDLMAAARALGDRIEHLCTASRAPRVMLIAHGLGGIVARLYLRELAGAARVEKLVTLGTPHQGTKLAALAPAAHVRDIQPASALIEDLLADDPLPTALDVTAVYPTFDTRVVPAELAYYPGAGNVQVEGVGHAGLLFSPRVYTLVRENLEYTAATATHPAAGHARS